MSDQMANWGIFEILLILICQYTTKLLNGEILLFKIGKPHTYTHTYTHLFHRRLLKS